MTKPKRVKCQVAGCVSGEPEDNGGEPGPYWTDSDNTSVAERKADLDGHVKMVHELAISATSAEASKISAEAEKLKAETEKLKAERAASGGSSGSGEHSAPKG